MDAKNAMHILQNLAHNTACEDVHHKKAHQHALGLPCPVVEEIQQAAGIVSKRIAELEKGIMKQHEENARLQDTIIYAKGRMKAYGIVDARIDLPGGVDGPKDL